ncbi:MAG: phosphatidate cytidylyltransferase [Clostridiales bacterium]|nr:phosphatidate cytidylyltransferase [Clostridiales bacterium]
MKVRVITGVSAALFGILCLWLIDTLFFTIVATAFAVTAVYEVIKTAKVTNKGTYALSFIFAALIPISIQFKLREKVPVPLWVILMIYIILHLSVMLAGYSHTKFEHVAVAVFVSVFLSYAISSMIIIRDTVFENPDVKKGAFYVLIGLTSAWLADTCAYFSGVAFGKHKMTPNISPKKTVEGAIGGVIGSVILNLIITFIFNQWVFTTAHVSYLVIGVTVLILAPLSIVGDLSASVIKRNYGEKDFGNLFPGHGGVMDRFDSISFTMPLLCGAITLFPKLY